ncbi:hypothetical protein ACOMHN_046236 [Nucella lapillus]
MENRKRTATQRLVISQQQQEQQFLRQDGQRQEQHLPGRRSRTQDRRRFSQSQTNSLLLVRDSRRLSQRNRPLLRLHGRRAEQHDHPYNRLPQHRRSPWKLTTISDRARVRRIGRRLVRYRLSKFTDMVLYLPHLGTDPEGLEGRRLIPHVALAHLLLAKDTEEDFQKLGVMRQKDGLRSYEMFENQLSCFLELIDAEYRVVARRRTQERAEQISSENYDSGETEAVGSHYLPPLNQNFCQQRQQQRQWQQKQQQQHQKQLQHQQQHHQQQQNNVQEHQQHSETDSAAAELYEQRIRQYQSTIQQLQELHQNNPDDHGGKLVYMHVALALLHLLERHHSSRSCQGSLSDFSVQHVRDLKARVLKEIYLCELQKTDEDELSS